MLLKTTPIQHEQVDYAEMCAQLQERLSSVESRLNAKHEKQQIRYQQQIRELQDQLDKGGPGTIWDDYDDRDGDASGGVGVGGWALGPVWAGRCVVAFLFDGLIARLVGCVVDWLVCLLVCFGWCVCWLLDWLVVLSMC